MTDGDILLDEDGDLVLDAGGDAAIVEDMETLIQDIRHRLITIKGSLAADPEYGASVPLSIQDEATLSNRQQLISDCLEELDKEDRILPQFTQVEVIPTDRESVSLTVFFVRKSDGEPGSTQVQL